MFFFSGKTVCHDQDLDCAQQFEDDPSICLNFPVWATKRCAKTCGTCTESNPDQPNTGISYDLDELNIKVKFLFELFSGHIQENLSYIMCRQRKKKKKKKKKGKSLLFSASLVVSRASVLFTPGYYKHFKCTDLFQRQLLYI